jgi:hypothetical protein
MEQHSDVDSFERAFMHELLHAFTATQLRLLDGDRTALTPDQRKSLENMEKLFHTYRDFFRNHVDIDMQIRFKIFERKAKILKMYTNNQIPFSEAVSMCKLAEKAISKQYGVTDDKYHTTKDDAKSITDLYTKEDRILFYAGTNVREFVSEVMTNQDVIDQASQIEYKEEGQPNKKVISKFKEFVKGIVKAFTKRSVSEAAIDEVLSFITPTTKVVSKEERPIVWETKKPVHKADFGPEEELAKKAKPVDGTVWETEGEEYTKVDEEQLDFSNGVTKQSIDFEEEQSFGYKERTIKNASADATIAIAIDFTTAGEQLTKSSVLKQNKLYIPVDLRLNEIFESLIGHKDPFDDTSELVLNDNEIFKLAEQIVTRLNKVNAKTLNIAGNGIYTLKKLGVSQELADQFAERLLEYVLYSDNLKTQIESIRTGGQTGFDEAGAKAGIKLGFPVKVLAPNGWIFRVDLKEYNDKYKQLNLKVKFNSDNTVDIFDEKQFKNRFKEPIQEEPVEFKTPTETNREEPTNSGGSYLDEPGIDLFLPVSPTPHLKFFNQNKKSIQRYSRNKNVTFKEFMEILNNEPDVDAFYHVITRC